MLESRALKLLATFVDRVSTSVQPLDFTALLYLQDKGLVEVTVVGGRITARCTPRGVQVATEKRWSHGTVRRASDG